MRPRALTQSLLGIFVSKLTRFLTRNQSRRIKRRKKLALAQNLIVSPSIVGTNWVLELIGNQDNSKMKTW